MSSGIDGLSKTIDPVMYPRQKDIADTESGFVASEVF